MSRSRNSDVLDTKVYVGGLTKEASKEEIERAFSHYGKLRNVFVARNPPGFAFVEFEDSQVYF
jgi:arginine/serine-rich splicing factor 7